MISRKLRRKLFGDEGRAIVYAAAGFVLFMAVVNGFYAAWEKSNEPPPPPPAARPASRADAGPPKVPARYVPPAGLELPLY